MDKIFYSPKEGTTGFWGLREVPEEPEYCTDFGDVILICESTFCKCKGMLRNHNAALESCKEKKLEICNPDEWFTYGPYARNSSNEVIKFKEGEIFDLPSNYEFKSYKKCQHNGIHNSTCIYHEVLRLVKTETKELCQNCKEPTGAICACFRNKCVKCGESVGNITFTLCDRCWDIETPKTFTEVPQPEPEESQTWTDIYNLGQEHGVRNYIAILSSEIEKKKQSIVNDLGRNDYAMYNGGYSQALKEISELLDSLTPKK